MAQAMTSYVRSAFPWLRSGRQADLLQVRLKPDPRYIPRIACYTVQR